MVRLVVRRRRSVDCLDLTPERRRIAVLSAVSGGRSLADLSVGVVVVVLGGVWISAPEMRWITRDPAMSRRGPVEVNSERDGLTLPLGPWPTRRRSLLTGLNLRRPLSLRVSAVLGLTLISVCRSTGPIIEPPRGSVGEHVHLLRKLARG